LLCCCDSAAPGRSGMYVEELLQGLKPRPTRLRFNSEFSFCFMWRGRAFRWAFDPGDASDVGVLCVASGSFDALPFNGRASRWSSAPTKAFGLAASMLVDSLIRVEPGTASKPRVSPRRMRAAGTRATRRIRPRKSDFGAQTLWLVDAFVAAETATYNAAISPPAFRFVLCGDGELPVGRLTLQCF
jgi:hypothetical protein